MRAAVRFVQRLFCVCNSLSQTLRVCQLPRGGSLWRCRILCGLVGNFSAMPMPLPLGEASSHSDARESKPALCCGTALRQHPKSSPFGGAGIEQSEMPERVRAQTPPVKRQFWKIRRFSRIANQKIYFPLIMRRATRSAFKIVLCPAGERA